MTGIHIPTTGNKLQCTEALVLTQRLGLVASLSTRVASRALGAQVLASCANGTLRELCGARGTLERVIALLLSAYSYNKVTT